MSFDTVGNPSPTTTKPSNIYSNIKYSEIKANKTKLLKNERAQLLLQELGKMEQMETESCCESAGLSGGWWMCYNS